MVVKNERIYPTRTRVSNNAAKKHIPLSGGVAEKTKIQTSDTDIVMVTHGPEEMERYLRSLQK